MVNTITVLNYDEVPEHRIKQLLDLAGFNTVVVNRGFALIDKNTPEAYKYAELQFRTLREAVEALQPYLYQVGYKIRTRYAVAA